MRVKAVAYNLVENLLYFWLPLLVIAIGIVVLIWLAVTGSRDEHPRMFPDDEEESKKK